MNNHYSSKPTQLTSASSIPCTLHISQTLPIPIRRKEIRAVNGERFVAPSFAEMMMDINRLEATLQALKDGKDIVEPSRRWDMGQPVLRSYQTTTTTHPARPE